MPENNIVHINGNLIKIFVRIESKEYSICVKTLIYYF